MQEIQVRPLGQEDPLEKARQPPPVFLPGEFQGQSSLLGHCPWGCKESDMTEHTLMLTFCYDLFLLKVPSYILCDLGIVSAFNRGI